MLYEKMDDPKVHSTDRDAHHAPLNTRKVFSHRPDLDGLRGLAIILVILQHYFYSFNVFFGQLGVSIFFVLSGYLTASIVSNDYDHGTFSFKSFYARRIKRLFPLLVITFLVALSIGWWILDAEGFRLLSGTVAASGAGLMNVVLSMGVDFFPTNPYQMPFAHFWSLAQEEQFYVIMPFVVIAIKKYHTVFRKMGIPILMILSFLSWKYWYDGRDIHARTYYDPLARFWELGIGVMLALSWGCIQRRIGGRYGELDQKWGVIRFIACLLMGIGCGLIVYDMLSADTITMSLFFCSIACLVSGAVLLGYSSNDESTFYRSMSFLGCFCLLTALGMPVLSSPEYAPLCVAAILSNIGMVFLIISGGNPAYSTKTHQDGAVPKAWSYSILSTPLMTYFGQISYSLYVIHYPLLALWMMSRSSNIWENMVRLEGGKGPVDTTLLLAMCALCLLVAPVLYKYIEDPARRAPYVWPWLVGMAVCIALGCAGAPGLISSVVSCLKGG